MDAYKHILVSSSDHILTITMNRPERRNAINETMGVELLSALDEADRNDDVRVVILTGAGTAFCAGGDLKGHAGGGEDSLPIARDLGFFNRELRHLFLPLIRKLVTLDKPVIGMVNGAATAAGFDLVMACDLRVGCEHSRFRVRFTSIGGVSAPGAAWFLARIVGLAKAAELLYVDDFVEAEEARQLGLLNKLAPAKEMVAETEALARKICRHDPNAVRWQKILLQQAAKVDLNSLQDTAAAAQTQLFFGGPLDKGAAAYARTD